MVTLRHDAPQPCGGRLDIAKRIVAACSRHAAKNLFGKRADEAVILPNAIPAEKFYCSQAEHELRKAEFGFTGRTVLFVGRFVYQKNLFFLLEAFALARKKREMTLVLVGGGADEEGLRKRAKELGAEGSVRFVPPCCIMLAMISMRMPMLSC